MCAVLGSNPGPEGMGKVKKEENTYILVSAYLHCPPEHLQGPRRMYDVFEMLFITKCAREWCVHVGILPWRT